MTLLPRNLTVPLNTKGLVVKAQGFRRSKYSQILQIVPLIILTEYGMAVALILTRQISISVGVKFGSGGYPHNDGCRVDRSLRLLISYGGPNSFFRWIERPTKSPGS
jgi:hypothetical protein